MIGAVLQYGSCISCMANAFSPDESSLDSEINALLSTPPVTGPSASPMNEMDLSIDEMDFTQKQLHFVAIKDQQIELLTGEVVRLRGELDSILGYNKTPGFNSTSANLDLQQEGARIEHELSSALSFNTTPDYEKLDYDISKDDISNGGISKVQDLKVAHANLQKDHAEVRQSLAEVQNMYDALFNAHERLQTENAQLRLSYDKIAMVEQLQQAAAAAADGSTIQSAHEIHMNVVNKSIEVAYENWQEAQRHAAAVASNARALKLNVTNVTPTQWSNITPSEIQMLPVSLETILRDR